MLIEFSPTTANQLEMTLGRRKRLFAALIDAKSQREISRKREKVFRVFTVLSEGRLNFEIDRDVLIVAKEAAERTAVRFFFATMGEDFELDMPLPGRLKRGDRVSLPASLGVK